MRHIKYHSHITQCGIGIAWVGAPNLPAIELIDSASATASDSADICARCKSLVTVHYCADNHGAREYRSDMTDREKSDRIDKIKGFHAGLRQSLDVGGVNRDNTHGISMVTPRGFGSVDGRRFREAYICGTKLPASGSPESCGYIAEFISDFHHDCETTGCDVESRRTAWAGMSGWGGTRAVDDFERVYEAAR